MTPSLRKLLLTVHITVSVGWLAAFLALAIAGLTSRDAQMVRAAYTAMELTARFVIAPLAFASLLSGLIESLGTPLGYRLLQPWKDGQRAHLPCSLAEM